MFAIYCIRNCIFHVYNLEWSLTLYRSLCVKWFLIICILYNVDTSILCTLNIPRAILSRANLSKSNSIKCNDFYSNCMPRLSLSCTLCTCLQYIYMHLYICTLLGPHGKFTRISLVCKFPPALTILRFVGLQWIQSCCASTGTTFKPSWRSHCHCNGTKSRCRCSASIIFHPGHSSKSVIEINSDNTQYAITPNTRISLLHRAIARSRIVASYPKSNSIIPCRRSTQKTRDVWVLYFSF